MAFVISRSTELPVACVAVGKRVLSHVDLVLGCCCGWQCFCAVCEAILATSSAVLASSSSAFIEYVASSFFRLERRQKFHEGIIACTS